MKCSVILFSALITIFGFYVEGLSRFSPLQCPEVKITNGRVRQRSRGRMLRFSCLPGFTLVGNRYASCLRGKWDVSPPACVSALCSHVSRPENSFIHESYGGGVLMFFCEPGYELRGPSQIYCNGRSWNDTLPTCTKNSKANPPMSCDFEKPDLCGWEQDPLHDFDWIRHNFNTPSWRIQTGPSHDHTLGAGESGYYLYVEATDNLENTTARIISPLYSSNLTETGCFSFWYHMYGVSIGALNVYFKAEGEANRRLMFTKSGNQGNQWWKGFFQLPKETTSFQIIIEGVRGSTYVSDIAIDDVSILQGDACTIEINATTHIPPTDDDFDQVEIVNGMQTCRDRCTYFNSTYEPTSLCQCDSNCYEHQNCCPDYTAYCIFSNTDDPFTFTGDSTEIESLKTTIKPKQTSTGQDRPPIPINPKDGIDPYPPKLPDKIQTTTTVKTKTETKSWTTVTPKRKPDMSSKKPVESNTRRATVKTTKMTTMNDYFDNNIDTNIPTEKYAQKSVREISKVTLPGIIAIVVGAIVGVAGTGLIIFIFFQKRNSYKKNSGTSALSDDSDVRFLTSDEMLDFNIARPEDMEM